jgi:peroxiredoxin
MNHNALVVLIAVACSACSAADAGTASTPPQPSNAPATAAPARSYMLTPTVAEKLGTLAPNTGVPLGEKIPDGHALDIDGHDVELTTLYKREPLLLVFYRGGWCPFCNLEIRAFTDAYPDFKKRGVNIVAVSVDKPEKEAKLKAEYDIPFTVLSDTDAKIIHAFHVVNQVSAEEYARLRGNNMDIEEYSGKQHHEIAIPAFFLVDQQGIVRWAHSDPDWKVRPSPAQLLAAIDATFPQAK